MDTSIHNMQTLFCQLGLAGDEERINAFIVDHTQYPETAFNNGPQGVYNGPRQDHPGRIRFLPDIPKCPQPT